MYHCFLVSVTRICWFALCAVSKVACFFFTIFIPNIKQMIGVVTGIMVVALVAPGTTWKTGRGTVYRLRVTQDVSLETASGNFNWLQYLMVSKFSQQALVRSVWKRSKILFFVKDHICQNVSLLCICSQGKLAFHPKNPVRRPLSAGVAYKSLRQFKPNFNSSFGFNNIFERTLIIKKSYK